jgi:hypothetical protein
MSNLTNAEFASAAAPAAVPAAAAAEGSFFEEFWPWMAAFYGAVNFVLYRETLRLLVWIRALNL